MTMKLLISEQTDQINYESLNSKCLYGKTEKICGVTTTITINL